MLQLSIIGLIVLSMIMVRFASRAAGIMNFTAAALILFIKVIPGHADGFDWIFIIILFLSGGVFYLSANMDRLPSGYENS